MLFLHFVCETTITLYSDKGTYNRGKNNHFFSSHPINIKMFIAVFFADGIFMNGTNQKKFSIDIVAGEYSALFDFCNPANYDFGYIYLSLCTRFCIFGYIYISQWLNH